MRGNRVKQNSLAEIEYKFLARMSPSLSHSLSVSPSLVFSLATATLDARNTEAPRCLRRGYTKNYVRRNDDKNECGSMSPISSGPPGSQYRDEVPIPDIDIRVNKNHR